MLTMANVNLVLPTKGVIGSLVSLVQTNSRQTVSTNSVNYPATLTNYPASSASGVAALKTMLTNQANACPQQKIVLMGYSQGAQVVGDVIGKLTFPPFR
jgi:acetylxylan esterase